MQRGWGVDCHVIGDLLDRKTFWNIRNPGNPEQHALAVLLLFYLQEEKYLKYLTPQKK